jgi:uncharacterized protein (TIGR00255 family)
MNKVFSMTGYGQEIWNAGDEKYLIVAKSVNHRFLELRVRLPQRYDGWEPEIQRKVKERFDRGHIDVVVSEAQGTVRRALPQADLELASRYAEILGSIKETLSLPGEVSLETVARMKDVIYYADPAPDIEGTWAEFGPVLEAVLGRLKDDREREGRTLADDLTARLGRLSEITDQIEKEAPQMISRFRERLIAKVSELHDGRLDVDRIEEEVVIYADRIDFTEELVRLKSHVTGFGRALGEGSPVGKKLDFILQEMGREVNTIGSKNTDAGIADRIISAKVEIERMRQQVQNIE